MENQSTNYGAPSLIILPTEILYQLLEFLPPKNLVQCRQVCSRFRDVIDNIICKDGGLWETFCRQDYEKIYKEAKLNSPDCLSWFEVYQSLSLWPRLWTAHENIIEFSHSNPVNNELISIAAQPSGNLMVHKKTSINYYDVRTLGVAKRKGFHGQYFEFVELEDVTVMLEVNNRLHIVKKATHDWKSDLNLNTYNAIVFNHVQSFIVVDRTVFYWKHEREMVFYYHLDNVKKPINILQLQIPDTVLSMGYTDNCLYILTIQNYCLYEYSNSKLSVKFTLERETVGNLMDCLFKHNMLENMNWRIYYTLLFHLGYKRHPEELQFICKINIYGDLFFVGIQTGLLNIYYKPVINGVLDLCKHTPIRKYDFSAYNNTPTPNSFPILNVAVVETKGGHKVFVCMQTKILVITYKNNFVVPRVPPSKAIL